LEQTSKVKFNKPSSGSDFVTDDRFWKENWDKAEAKFNEIDNKSKNIAYLALFPKSAEETDDTERIKRAVSSLSTGGTLEFERDYNYKVSSTIDLNSYMKLNGNMCTITFNGANDVLFYTFKKERITFKEFLLIDSVGSNTAFLFEGSSPSSISDYSRLIQLYDVCTNGFNLSLDSNYARKWSLFHCDFFSKNGILIRNKSVEISIGGNTVIYGSVTPFASNYGIKLDCDSGNVIDYPEGVMISDSTIDNFYRSVWVNNVYVFQLMNSYIASRTEGDAAIYFGTGSASLNQDITISNLTISGKGIKFQPSTSSAQRYRAVINNIVFESIVETNIYIDNLSQDIHFDGIKVYASSNAIIANCINNNKNITFNNIYGSEGCIGGIQVRGTNSQGSKITNISYDGTGNFLYLEQPVYLANIQATDTYTKETLQKYVSIDQGSYALSAAIATVTKHVAKGQKGKITVTGKTTYSGSQPLLNVTVPTGIEIPNGAGWSAAFISVGNAQYLSVTIPFIATANVTNGIFKVANYSTGGAVSFDYHSYFVFEII
jgi:hypothetical protein